MTESSTQWTEEDQARFKAAKMRDPVSGVVYVPQGVKVPPCPFPCSICRAKCRQ
jgi:hypothetical protein